MKAVIVAAGSSRRLYPLTLETPKPLIKIDGTPLIERSIKILHAHGIVDIAVVVGYLKEKFRVLLEEGVKLIENPDYASTNNMASLYCARRFVNSGDFVYLHGDIYYHPDILKKCITNKKDFILAVDKKKCDREDMKVAVEKGLVVRSSKDILPEEAYGEWIGIAKLSGRAPGKLFSTINKILKEKKKTYYDTYAFTRLADAGCRINKVHTSGLPWMEIDFPAELRQAKKLHIPMKGRL